MEARVATHCVKGPPCLLGAIPLGPSGEPSPLGCLREATPPLCCLPKVADSSTFGHPGGGQFSNNYHERAIRDVVKIPAGLKPGRYVLGWRWDCEATAQVWSSCSDVELVA